MLGRQISGKPIDYAILQCNLARNELADASKGMLVLAKRHAINYKKLGPFKTYHM